MKQSLPDEMTTCLMTIMKACKRLYSQPPQQNTLYDKVLTSLVICLCLDISSGTG